MSFKQKVFNFLNRHSIFYKMRFLLISRKTNYASIHGISFQAYNGPHEIPTLFKQMNELIKVQPNKSDFERSKDIASWMRKTMKGGCGLGLDSESTLHAMMTTKAGVCSDYSQLFNIFCLLNNIKVREWGVIKRDTLHEGHAFNEVFDNFMKKWVLLDVSKLIYFKGDTNTPLSVQEVFKKNANPQAVFFGDHDKPLKSLHVFDSAFFCPFIVSNYNNFKIDQIFKVAKSLPASVRHLMLLFTGRMYLFYFPSQQD